jgi:D-3-phosphoglycerate dehydrogenase / 2-oxoglutarate reductase
MAFKVLNPKKLSDAGEKILQDNGIEVLRGSGPTKEDMLRDIAGCDALVVWKSANYTIDKEVINAGKKLKLIARFGVGMEIVDVEYAQSKGIIVTNTPTSNSNSVAEHTLYLLLGCAKNGHIVDKRFRGGEFNSIWQLNGVELEGQVLGIVGVGNIGRMVAQKAKHGFDMKVIGYDPYAGAKFPSEIEKVDTLHELLTQSDFVSLHVPATSETIGMLGTEQFKMMKSGACLINASRGEIVKEGELVEALSNGTIRGAGLDVFTKEPLDVNSPLFNLDNVIMTPHYAGYTAGAVKKTGIQVAESIVAVSQGKKPEFELPKKR